MTAERLLFLFERAGKRAVRLGDAAAGAIVSLDLEGRWYGVLGGEVVSRVNPEAASGQSARMAFAFTAGAPIAKVAVKAGMAEVFKNMPLLDFALAGGFTTNFISTMIATAKKKAFGDYTVKPHGTLMLNYALAIVSGVRWYGQYFSFGTRTTKLGEYSYAGWRGQAKA